MTNQAVHLHFDGSLQIRDPRSVRSDPQAWLPMAHQEVIRHLEELTATQVSMQLWWMDELPWEALDIAYSEYSSSPVGSVTMGLHLDVVRQLPCLFGLAN